MSKFSELLRYAGFSKTFVKMVNLSEDGFMVAIDEPNLLRYVLADFATSTEDCRSMVYTNLPSACLTRDELEEDDLMLQDFKTQTIGPGYHKHKSLPIILCCESITSGSHLSDNC